MTSRERLIAVLQGERPDRVPVTIYEHSPFNDDWPNHEPTYARLLELEREYGDSFVQAPIDCPVFIGDPNAMHGTDEKRADGTLVRRIEIDTPKGKLRGVTRRDPEMMTNWQIEPLIKSDDDVERLLSMPDAPGEVNVERIRDLERRVGDEGILCYSVGDAIGHVVGLFDFEDFVMRCYADDGPIRALLDKAQGQVLHAIEKIGAHVDNAAFRLWGPEYCGAPLMDPHVYFPRYVIEQDKAATRAIQSTGNFSVIHCHGKLKDILEMIGEIGANALEPIETLPIQTADVTLAEVVDKLGGRMCLMGAVQAFTLETATAEDVRRQLREAIDVAGPTGRFVLLPTSAPFMVPLDQRCGENIEVMYKTAHEYGRYDD